MLSPIGIGFRPSASFLDKLGSLLSVLWHIGFRPLNKLTRQPHWWKPPQSFLDNHSRRLPALWALTPTPGAHVDYCACLRSF
jgi:hypothetical protein